MAACRLARSFPTRGANDRRVLTQFGPFELREGSWDTEREAYGNKVVRTIAEYCPGFENGFARIRCPDRAEEYLLAFSCKTRELCPSCAAKRSVATTTLLAEDVLEVETFDPLEFLVRVIMHIPEPRRHLVRYFGWYSNVSRGRRGKEEAEAERVAAARVGASRDERDRTRDARAVRRSWAQLIKRIYEVDPLVCPSCGSEMKVIAFITEHEVIDCILRHLMSKEERKERAPPS